MRTVALAGLAAQPMRILCLGAHSDDIEIGCGATIVTMLAANKAVELSWVVFSAQGAREEEARRSAATILAGANRHELTIHGFTDGVFPHEAPAAEEEVRGNQGAIQPRPGAHASGRRPASGSPCGFRVDLEHLSRSLDPGV